MKFEVQLAIDWSKEVGWNPVLKMRNVFFTMRMYRNGFPKGNLNDAIYGITTFELGKKVLKKRFL